MIVAIVGTRELDIPWCLQTLWEKNFDENPHMEAWTHIVTGDCPTGGDFAAREYAKKHNIPATIYKANWRPQGNNGPVDRGAGMKRNTQIVQHPGLEKVYALWDGESKGTLDTIKKAIKLDIRVEIIPAKKMPKES